MVLNLRSLSASPKVMADSFVCHGRRFSAHTYRQREFGYADAMGGHNPTMETPAYRQGYLEYLVNATVSYSGSRRQSVSR